MKKVALLFILFSVTLHSQAQDQIKYEILKDDPSDLPWIVANLDIFGMEVNYGKGGLGLNLGIGVWGHVEIPKVPAVGQYILYRSYFNDGQLNPDTRDFAQTTDVQLGGMYFLSDNTKTRPFAVGLNSKVIGSEKYKQGNKSYEKITTQTIGITVNGKMRNQFGVRAGFMFRGSGIAVYNVDLASLPGSTAGPYEYAKHNSTSVYAGLVLRQTSNLVIKTDKYGIESGASHTTSWFLDAIISPVNKFKHPSGDDINQLVKDSIGGSPIGLRIGYQANAIEKRAITGKKFGMGVRGELGYKPYTGWYGAATIGLTILKIRK